MACNYIPMPKEETYILIERAQRGDENAKEKLTLENTGLVRKLAARFVSDEQEMEDLMQIGYMGLLRAIEKFNPEFDVMFSTYAVPMILGELKRFFRDNGKVKVSRTLKSDMTALRQTENAFELKEGRSPRIHELAEVMGISRERVLEIMEAGECLRNIASLETQTVDQFQINEHLCDGEEKEIDRIMLRDEIAALKEKEKAVIFMRYYRDMTQKQIAERLGVSQVQISRIERQALGKIRQKMTEVSS